MINVIWVDDLILNPDGSQTDLCNSIVNSAYDEGIDITPFATYDEAYNAIETNPSKWIAIILDVRNDKASEGSENRDFLKMREKIKSFRMEHGNSVEPFIFVFSADAVTISDAKKYFIKDTELQSKEVYIKPNDTNVLFKDIIKIAEWSPVYTTYKKHEDIMNEMKNFGWSDEKQNVVFSILRSMDKMKWPNEDQRTVYKLYKSIEIENDFKNHSLYPDMRKIVESDLYKRIEEVGLMNDYPEYLKNEGKKESINVRSVFVGEKKRGKVDEDYSNRFPIYIQRAFHSLTEISQNGSHPLIVKKHTAQGKAPYLLKSCLYDLLTIINWESQL